GRRLASRAPRRSDRADRRQPAKAARAVRRSGPALDRLAGLDPDARLGSLLELSLQGAQSDGPDMAASALEPLVDGFLPDDHADLVPTRARTASDRRLGWLERRRQTGTANGEGPIRPSAMFAVDLDRRADAGRVHRR